MIYDTIFIWISLGDLSNSIEDFLSDSEMITNLCFAVHLSE